MRRALITKSATVVAGLATALTLSACSFEFSVGPGSEGNDEEQTEETTERDRNGDEETGAEDTNGGGSRDDSGTEERDIPDQDPTEDTGTGSGSDSGSGSGRSSEDEYTSGSGDGSDVTIPGSELAVSVKEAAEEESGVTGIDVTCRDLTAYSVGSSTTCDMEMPNGDKYFPLVKVTSISGGNVEYKLEFPGVHF